MNYKIEKLDLDTLPAEKKKKYALFIPPRIRCALDGIDPDDMSSAEILAIGLEFKNEPVGIAVASNYEDLGLAELFALKIMEPHQDVNLGLKMLQKIEAESSHGGAVVVTFSFRKTELDSSFIEEVLNKAEWANPKIFMIRYFFDMYTFNPPWYKNFNKLPSKFKIFPWSKLKKSERDRLENECYQGHFSESIQPFQKEDSVEYINSLGLRHKKEVIGWCITHRISPDTIKYTSAFIKPGYRLSGSLRLGVQSIKLQQESSVRWAIFEINLENVDPSWFNFVQKRFAPYAIEVDNIYQTWKATSSDTFSFKGIN